MHAYPGICLTATSNGPVKNGKVDFDTGAFFFFTRESISPIVGH